MTPDLVAMKPRRHRASISAIVTRGNAEEVAFVFNAGSAVGPFSVGSHGDWRISASAVAPVHFHLTFDGETLFGAAAAETHVLGTPLGAHWTPLPETCDIRFGAASIAVARADGRGPRVADPFAADTIARPVPSFLADLEAGHENDAFQAKTVMRQPYDAARRRARPRPPIVDPFAAETIVEPCIVPEPLEALAAPEPPPPELATPNPQVLEPAAPRPGVPRAAQPGAPLVRKLMAALVLAAVAVVGARAVKVRRAASTAGPAVAASAAPPPVASVQSSTVPSTSTATVPPEPLPFVNGRSPERQAVDRVARGAYADAATLYEQLARRTNDPTFDAAARIARRKARVP